MEKRDQQSVENSLQEETILAAFEKLSGGAVLVEQNPLKQSVWAELAHQGHRVAWAIRDGQYLARIVDGEVEMLDRS